MSSVLVITVVVGVLIWYMTGTTGATQVISAVLGAIIAGLSAFAGLKLFSE
jgi:hypothetical protein